MKISVGEKVLWKYVLYYLNNKNCCLNNTTKQTLNFHHSNPKFREPHIRFSYLAWFFFLSSHNRLLQKMSYNYEN